MTSTWELNNKEVTILTKLKIIHKGGVSMQVSVSRQHLSIGSSLQEYVKERVTSSIKKYFDHAPSATVHFNKQNHEFFCDIVVNDGTGRHVVIKSSASSDDVYFAFDAALSKVEKQLRKYKSKLKDHSSKLKVSEISPNSTKYVISPTKIDDEDDETKEIDFDNPVIVAEKATKILKLSVGQAVMKMDLEDLPALMFRNVKTDRINVVYYRKDGNISWVDSF
ncbi:MAG TPA: ribosome-associated translation inhibitor RaiA [Candidatus Megaira endosymbiont of Stentor roeselii]|nr:ribosome-associated translation inhibitor RaiA [Candidatus Megaera endosymbiont of Stentor roeselii]